MQTKHGIINNSTFIVLLNLESVERKGKNTKFEYLKNARSFYRFLLSLIRKHSKTFKKQHLQKTFSPVCMLQVQYASTNAFYSMW